MGIVLLLKTTVTENPTLLWYLILIPRFGKQEVQRKNGQISVILA
jgi:hypothetical protein